MKELHDLLAEMLGVFDELLEVEAHKLDVVSQNDIAGLDECIKKEEALSLKLRGIEQRREELQRIFGHEGLTLRQTAEKVNGEDGRKLLKAHAALSERAKELGLALDGTRKVIESNLESVELTLQERVQEEDGGYQPSGEKAGEREKPRFTPKEV